MRTTAAVLYESGLARPYARTRPLRVEEVQLAEPGEGEVLVRLGAAGLCHSDLSVIDGSRPRVMPMVLGHEAAGVVERLGAGVDDLAVGDHVVFNWLAFCGSCPQCAAARPWLCDRGLAANVAGTLLTGAQRFHDGRRPLHHHLGVSGFAQHTVAVRSSLVKIAADIPLNVAALFGCAVMTGVGAVVNTANVSRGESVAIFGLGGVGLSAVMGAALAGAEPIIAVDIQPQKLQLARRAGATHLINAAETDPIDAIRSLTAASGVDYAFETAGTGSTAHAACQSTRRGGQAVLVGLPPPSQTLSIIPQELVASERIVRGSYMGSCDARRDIPRFIALWQAGRLPVELLLDASMKLAEINAGFDRLADGQAVRQIIEFD